MKRKILLILSIILQIHVFSQDLLTPLREESFGLNNHTNRDISYFLNLDSNNNSLIVGTTEKDSTFTNIIISKLSENLNLIWQKELSIRTDLSYDIPIKSFINTNNELYIIGRSSLKKSTENGLIFIVKYNEEGELLFNKTLGNIDGSDYVDYGYLDVQLNSDDTLNLVYSPLTHQVFQPQNFFNFLKISNTGDIISSFKLEIQHRGFKGVIKNSKYYFLVKELVDETNDIYTYKFYQINGENNINILEITNSDFINYYNNVLISEHVKLNVDINENCFLICQNKFNNKIKETINLSRIDNSHTLTYSITTSNDKNYHLIDSFINEHNDNIVVANNLNNNRIDFIKVDTDNTVQTISNTSSFLATGFKKNKDNTFLITTSNSNIRMFSNNFVELKSFNTSDTYELIDFVKINDNSISTTGTSFDKMFPESDYNTQLDIHAEKLNDTQVLFNYSFSGVGTSRAFQQKVIIDNDNNYLVLVAEKMGPEYLGIGGAKPPLSKRIIKYDSNLNKLWESDVPEHIFNIVTHSYREIDYFIDNSNNLFLNLPRAGNNYGLGFDLYKVTPSGNFEFINSTYVADKFFVNNSSIFMAKNYFLYEESSKLFILDKKNANLTQEINVGHEKFLDFFSIGNDYYFFTFEEISNNTPDIIYLYKNGVKIFTRNLPNNYGIHQYEINDEGTLFFSTDYGGDKRLNKIDINNSYTYYNTSDKINRFKIFNNGNIFLYLYDNSTLVLDKNMNFITNGDTINSYYPFLITWKNNILLGTTHDNSVRIINENGEVISHFTIQGFLGTWSSQLDNHENLITVGQFGNRIHTYDEYGWFRGFIHNYGDLNNTLSIDDVIDNNNENKPILYPNPTSNILNIKVKNLSIEKIILFDISGKKLKVFHQTSINLSQIKSGIYFLEIHTKSKKVLNSKVIKI